MCENLCKLSAISIKRKMKMMMKNFHMSDDVDKKIIWSKFWRDNKEENEFIKKIKFLFISWYDDEIKNQWTVTKC